MSGHGRLCCKIRSDVGSSDVAVNVFGLAPDGNNCTPSESNSAVMKGFRGSGELDLGLGAALSRLGASLAGVSQ
jgi:hypothetical protein